jgi:long-chain acyl-CoA synthetase
MAGGTLVNLAGEVLARAAELPDRQAVQEIATSRSLTFGELKAAAERLGSGLSSAGFDRGARVGIGLPNSLEWVLAVYGCWLAGATPVLVNHTLTAAEIESLLSEVGVGAAFLAGDRELASVSAASTDLAGNLSFARAPEPVPNPPGHACIIFTSGTEGRPKPAVLRHDGLATATASIARALRGRPGPYPIARSQAPPSFICLPLSHTGGLTSLIFAFHVGRSVLLARKFSPAITAEAIQRFRIDSLVATPTMLHMLLEEPGFDLGSVRTVQSTGAPLAAALQRQFEERFGVPVIQNYGQTETAHVAGWTRDDFAAQRWRPGSVGRPYEGVEVEIRDADGSGRPPGEVGEIVVRSAHLMAGYEGRGESLPGGWVATGDLGYLDEDGYLFVVDRKREVIICGGFNIYPAELEALILEHPDVAEVAVMGVPDGRLGEVPKAFAVLRPGAAATGPDIVRFTQARTAHYRALREAEIVPELPKTATEKVHRAVIREQAATIGARREQPRQPDQDS